MKAVFVTCREECVLPEDNFSKTTVAQSCHSTVDLIDKSKVETKLEQTTRHVKFMGGG